MNRFNFGNQLTNGLQILGVAGTTAAGYNNAVQAKNQAMERQKIADASSALNNMSFEDVQKVGQYRADRLRDEMNNYYKNKGNNLGSIDDILSDSTLSTLNSPQKDYIETYVRNNINYDKTYIRDGRRFRKSTEDDLSIIIKSQNSQNSGGEE